MAYISPLYGAVRHERFGNSKHQILVQANKLGKFVPMKELTESGSSIFFGDLKGSLIVGERKALLLQKSTEYGFIRDEIAIKANMRLDIKKALGEAMVVGKSTGVVKSRTKVA